MNHRTIRLLLSIVVSGIAFFGPAPAAQAEQRVLIVERNPDDASTWGYEPADITIPAGTTVVWEWRAQDKHSVTADNGSFDSGVKQGSGQTWKHTFTEPGDYPYSCTPHPFMFGSVKVTG